MENVFQRYEYKYILTKEQKEMILNEISGHIEPDIWGRKTIQSIYYDTKDAILVRRSIDKPVYKEKLRIRSYGTASENGPVYLEMKRKYLGETYKRRLAIKEKDARKWMVRRREDAAKYNDRETEAKACNNLTELANNALESTHTSGISQFTVEQIAKELTYFTGFYGGLYPSVQIMVDREAWFDKEDPGFRITFDENLLYRTNDFDLKKKAYGQPIIDENLVLMELKTGPGMKLWMVEMLEKYEIRKQAFSKYGRVYEIKKGNLYEYV